MPSCGSTRVRRSQGGRYRRPFVLPSEARVDRTHHSATLPVDSFSPSRSQIARGTTKPCIVTFGATAELSERKDRQRAVQTRLMVGARRQMPTLHEALLLLRWLFLQPTFANGGSWPYSAGSSERQGPGSELVPASPSSNAELCSPAPSQTPLHQLVRMLVPFEELRDRDRLAQVPATAQRLS